MNWNDLSFKKKNRLLWIGAVLLVLLCWFLSFSKTFTAHQEYVHLTRASTGVLDQNDAYYQINKKYQVLDSLVGKFSVDTAVFESSFLQHVSLALEGLPVALSYDGSKPVSEQEDGIVTKEITLQGKYSAVVQAVKRLEDFYYVSTIQHKTKTGYLVRIKGVKVR